MDVWHSQMYLQQKVDRSSRWEKLLAGVHDPSICFWFLKFLWLVISDTVLFMFNFVMMLPVDFHICVCLRMGYTSKMTSLVHFNGKNMIKQRKIWGIYPWFAWILPWFYHDFAVILGMRCFTIVLSSSQFPAGCQASQSWPLLAQACTNAEKNRARNFNFDWWLVSKRDLAVNLATILWPIYGLWIYTKVSYGQAYDSLAEWSTAWSWLHFPNKTWSTRRGNRLKGICSVTMGWFRLQSVKTIFRIMFNR